MQCEPQFQWTIAQNICVLPWSAMAVALMAGLVVACRTAEIHLPASAASTKPSEAPKKAPWINKRNRKASKSALIAAAVSSDSHYLAVAGVDMQIHVWDIRKNEYLRAFPGQEGVSWMCCPWCCPMSECTLLKAYQSECTSILCKEMYRWYDDCSAAAYRCRHLWTLFFCSCCHCWA